MNNFKNTHPQHCTIPNIGMHFCVNKLETSNQIADPLKQDLRCENGVHCFFTIAFSSSILAIANPLKYWLGSVFQNQWATLSHF